MKTFEEYFKQYHPEYDVANNTYKIKRLGRTMYPVNLCRGDMEALFDYLMQEIEERDQTIEMLRSIGSYDPSEF